MSRPRVTILYEDRYGPSSGFGLHRLIVAFVFDVTDGERHLVDKALEGRPMKGDSKLLKACRGEITDISDDGHPVAAVFDNDRIRRLLKLPANAANKAVVEAVHKGCRAPHLLSVFLLEENTESVIQALADCDPSTNKETIARALAKEPDARDLLLVGAARSDKRSIRDCILRRVPSLKHLTDTLAGWLIGH